jgi:hypothetical protein
MDGKVDGKAVSLILGRSPQAIDYAVPDDDIQECFLTKTEARELSATIRGRQSADTRDFRRALDGYEPSSDLSNDGRKPTTLILNPLPPVIVLSDDQPTHAALVAEPGKKPLLRADVLVDDGWVGLNIPNSQKTQKVIMQVPSGHDSTLSWRTVEVPATGHTIGVTLTNGDIPSLQVSDASPWARSLVGFDVPWGPLRLAQRPVPASLQFAPSFAVLENSL